VPIKNKKLKGKLEGIRKPAKANEEKGGGVRVKDSLHKGEN